jgi:hypothetical protein
MYKIFKMLLIVLVAIVVGGHLTGVSVKCTKNSSACVKCDISLLRETEKDFAKLSRQKILDFLCTFDPRCATNIEYSEYSNELLFKILDRYTGEFLWALSKKQVHKQYIYETLSNPLLDVNADFLKDKVRNEKGANDSIRKSVLKSLDKISNN